MVDVTMESAVDEAVEEIAREYGIETFRPRRLVDLPKWLLQQELDRQWVKRLQIVLFPFEDAEHLSLCQSFLLRKRGALFAQRHGHVEHIRLGAPEISTQEIKATIMTPWMKVEPPREIRMSDFVEVQILSNGEISQVRNSRRLD